MPEDVAIIGFDNRFEGAIQEPNLTSVHVPLFDIGYCALNLLLESIHKESPLPEKTMVETQLVIRQSCGCKDGTLLSEISRTEDGQDQPLPEAETSNLVAAIAQTTMQEVQNFSEDEIRSFSQQLVDTFQVGLQAGDNSKFQEVLLEILNRTESNGDVVYLWQKALKLLSIGFKDKYKNLSLKIDKFINEARSTINYQMQLQYRRHVMRERWVTSRLSLLTAELLTALGKNKFMTSFQNGCLKWISPPQS